QNSPRRGCFGPPAPAPIFGREKSAHQPTDRIDHRAFDVVICFPDSNRQQEGQPLPLLRRLPLHRRPYDQGSHHQNCTSSGRQSPTADPPTATTDLRPKPLTSKKELRAFLGMCG
ncbi:hypothetical protein ILUMI_25790, partial [Ignelater luminosus]